MIIKTHAMAMRDNDSHIGSSDGSSKMTAERINKSTTFKIIIYINCTVLARFCPYICATLLEGDEGMRADYLLPDGLLDR